MTFEEILNIDIKLGEIVTLESGWGYFINQNFYRLYEDTDAIFVSSNGSGDRAIKAVKAVR